MRKRPPLTLIFGIALIVTCEVLLFIDVHNRGGVVVGSGEAMAKRPHTTVAFLGLLAAANITPVGWLGYLFTFDGLLTWTGWLRSRPGDKRIRLSPIRARPNRFLVAWLTSIPMWCWFDWINFAFGMDAWRYLNMPPRFGDRVVGYFIAFAAISPGMFLAAEWFQQLGLRRLNSPHGVRITRPIQIACFLLGVVFTVFPFFPSIAGDAVGSLTVWVSLMFLVDPINFWLGAPSLIGDWRAGRWGRTLALMAGGALCGFLWEFWNYWSLTKWRYHLPFLGSMEQYKYFEMPWLGFLGFLPFAIECWVMLNLVLAVWERLGLRMAEPLADEYGVM